MISIETSQLHLISKEGWQKWKLAHAFQLIGSGTTPPTSNVEYFQGAIPWVNTGDLNDGYINSVNKCVSEKAVNDFPTLKIYSKGSIIIALYGATIGKLGILQIDACTNQACCILAEPIYLDTKFVFYWLMSERSNIIELAHGGGQPNISQEIVKNLRILAPVINKQKAIASFLDRKTAAIDTLITKKQRLIQLLEEKRTALINQAVTKGLNPNVPMKNSGIAWISKIPEHWEVSRLGFLSTTIQTGPFGSQLHASEYIENGIPLVNPINIQRGNIVADYQKTVNQEVAIRLSRHKLLIGDLVFARRGELGRCGVINKNNNGWLCGTGCIQVRFSKIKVDPDYLNLFISIPWVASWLSLESVGSTMDNLNTEILSTLPIILPPKEEQIKIFQYIELKKYLFDKLITTIDKQISKLQEYRQSLITAAVTGKIDIRKEVAA